MSKDDLPSINDILEDGNLPSYKDFMEKKEELPSVEDYIQEETQTIENSDGESFLEVTDVIQAPEWSEKGKQRTKELQTVVAECHHTTDSTW